jgi:probable HAF family extracellular repeat protein
VSLFVAMRRRCAAPAFALMLILASAATASAQYTYTKIMYPGSAWTEVAGINDAGQIVGTYTLGSGIVHGFMYHNGTYTTVNMPGMAHNYLFGINDAGQMVGGVSEVLPRGPYHATLLSSGAWSLYDFPGNETDGRAINSLGHIAGIYNAGFGTPDHGFLKVGDEYTSIDFPGASITYVFGLNDAGYISGTFRDAQGVLKGFMYMQGVYSSVAYPGATETYLGGINNANVAVGWKVEGGKVNGFVLNGGSYRSVIVPFATAVNTKPRSINDLGQVVGTYTSSDCPIGCAFLATPAPALPALCQQTVAMTYTNGTLDLRFTLKTSVATTWRSYLVAQGVPYLLWSLPLAPINPQTSVSVPVQLPPLGTVLLASVLSTPTQGSVCVDFSSLNMAAPGGGS